MEIKLLRKPLGLAARKRTSSNRNLRFNFVSQMRNILVCILKSSEASCRSLKNKSSRNNFTIGRVKFASNKLRFHANENRFPASHFSANCYNPEGKQESKATSVFYLPFISHKVGTHVWSHPSLTEKRVTGVDITSEAATRKKKQKPEDKWEKNLRWKW